MSNFDLVIQESIGDTLKNIGSALSKGAGSISSAFETAKDVYKKPFSLPLSKSSDLQKELDKNKSKLSFVTYDSATASIKKLKEPLKTSTTEESSSSNVFSPTVVIMDNLYGFSGVKAQIVNFEKPYSLDFRLFINQVRQVVNQDESEENDIDIESFIFQTKPRRFWVKISSTSPTTTVSESFDDTIDYGYSMIQEAKGLVPPNEIGYATWFIFDSNRPEFNQKFKITLANQKPDPSLGKAFRLDDMSGKPTGLIQVGQDTLYPRWYFLNDLVKYKSEDDKKNQTPTGINVPSSYSGDVKL